MSEPPIDFKTAQDTALFRRGVDQSMVMKLHSVRLILDAGMRANSKLSVEEIASVTGFSVTRVREVLTSDEYRGLVDEAIGADARGALYQGIMVLRDIMQDAEAKPSDRIAAVRELRSIATDTTKFETDRRANSGAEAMQRLLDVIGLQNHLAPATEQIIKIDPKITTP